MMTTTVQCPNTGCGRVSHLGGGSVGPDFPVSALPYQITLCCSCCSGLAVDGCVRASTSWWWGLWFRADPGVALGSGPRHRAEAEGWGSSGFESGEVLIGCSQFRRR